MKISVINIDRLEVKNNAIIWLMILSITTLYCPSNADKVSDKIYSNVQSEHFCSRRLNATHQVGCQSELGGNLGVVWIVENNEDLEHILKTGPTPPYIVILRREHYTRKNLLDFKSNTDRVAGVVFLDGDHDNSKFRSIPFSPDDRCPNRYSGLYANNSQYKDCQQNLWNPESQISGLLYDDIPYPIFLINEKKSIDEIETCFKNNNLAKGKQRKQDTYPLCSMQLDSFMTAASDTMTCLNSHSLMDEFFQTNGQRCYPVNNQNIFAYFKPEIGPLLPVEGGKGRIMTPTLVDAQSVVMLITKLSSLSMFTEISPGADSTVTSIVTMLAIAEALGRHRNDSEAIKSKRNIAFSFIDSEPFDYTGSSRMVYNMHNDSFPYKKYYKIDTFNSTDVLKNMNLTALDYVINLDQMASYPNAVSIHLHTDPTNLDNNKLNRILSILDRTAKSDKVKFVYDDQKLPLPPTSVHEFIKQSQNTSIENKLLGLVLSNYGNTYNNLFYNSIYDDSHNIYQTSKEKLIDHISQVGSFIAKSVYELAFESQKDTIVVDREIVKELLECYLIKSDCELFTKAWQAGHKLPGGPILTYKDATKRSDDMNGLITANLLAYFIGDRLTQFNLTKCYEENAESYVYSYQYVNGKGEPIKDENSGICIRSQVIMTDATSPSYKVTEEGFEVDQRYPAWTVSLQGIRNPPRLFIRSSPIHQWCVFLIGVIITIMSFITVYHIRNSISNLQIDTTVQRHQVGT